MKHSLKYGSIAGLIMVASWFISSLLFSSGDDQPIDGSKSEILGFFAMFLAILVIFYGVKRYRDQKDEKNFPFRKGFMVGFNVVLVASLIYMVGWMVYYPLFIPDFMAQYQELQMALLEQSELSEEAIKLKKQEMSDWISLYENPFVMAGITFMEFFPIGLLGALIAAFVLERKS